MGSARALFARGSVLHEGRQVSFSRSPLSSLGALRREV